MKITFYGVRGSCPCPCEANMRYGGNTACVILDSPGEAPIMFDLGTGIRTWGLTQPTDGSFRASALVTHIHFDHIQGLPFFPPIDRPGAQLDIYAPTEPDMELGQAFSDLIKPPYFPITRDEFRGEMRFHSVSDEDFAIGSAKVKVRSVPHKGATAGYRVDRDGASVAYISDHQAPLDLESVSDSVLELCDGVDVLIHDAQYTPEEFQEKSHWGHCTFDYAVLVAKRAGARKLVLFHHDPGHDDEQMDELVAGAEATAARLGLDDVVAASEGLVIDLSPR
ncbi:MAG TPA: MBL fold metallo-hydrolase [Acidimicrobiales bacterium]|nr:MBL fold metallo-hydrolase [Acidimicrobiales bacterium]